MKTSSLTLAGLLLCSAAPVAHADDDLPIEKLIRFELGVEDALAGLRGHTGLEPEITVDEKPNGDVETRTVRFRQLGHEVGTIRTVHDVTTSPDSDKLTIDDYWLRPDSTDAKVSHEAHRPGRDVFRTKRLDRRGAKSSSAYLVRNGRAFDVGAKGRLLDARLHLDLRGDRPAEAGPRIRAEVHRGSLRGER